MRRLSRILVIVSLLAPLLGMQAFRQTYRDYEGDQKTWSHLVLRSACAIISSFVCT